MYCILFFDPHLFPVLFMTVPCDDHLAVFLKSYPSGDPLLASLIADYPKSGGLDELVEWVPETWISGPSLRNGFVYILVNR